MPRAEKNLKMPEKAERIAKVIARAGLCSRREAERWISEGRVILDGKVLDSPATVVSHNNKIVVDGELYEVINNVLLTIEAIMFVIIYCSVKSLFIILFALAVMENIIQNKQ